MKKKLISGLLAATLAFSLAACGGSSSTAAEVPSKPLRRNPGDLADLTGDGAPDVDRGTGPVTGWRLQRYCMQTAWCCG